jgi:hypothetical protein
MPVGFIFGTLVGWELAPGALLGKFLKTRLGCRVHLEGHQVLGDLWCQATLDRVE